MFCTAQVNSGALPFRNVPDWDEDTYGAYASIFNVSEQVVYSLDQHSTAAVLP
jgi:hypothetical protein